MGDFMSRLNKIFTKLNWLFKTTLPVVLAVPSISRCEGQETSAKGSKGSIATIQLSATLPTQLRLNISDIDLNVEVSDPGQSSKVIAVPLVSSWVLSSSSNGVQLVGFFDSGEAAMSDGAGHAIPTTHVLGGLNQEGMSPFIEPGPAGPTSSLTLFREKIGHANVVGFRSDTLRIQLEPISDLGMPSAEYYGTLHLRLFAF